MKVRKKDRRRMRYREWTTYFRLRTGMRKCRSLRQLRTLKTLKAGKGSQSVLLQCKLKGLAGSSRSPQPKDSTCSPAQGRSSFPVDSELASVHSLSPGHWTPPLSLILLICRWDIFLLLHLLQKPVETLQKHQTSFSWAPALKKKHRAWKGRGECVWGKG